MQTIQGSPSAPPCSGAAAAPFVNAQGVLEERDKGEMSSWHTRDVICALSSPPVSDGGI